MVASVLDKLREQFGKLRTLRGKDHTYLGVKFDDSKEGKLKVDMQEHLEEILRNVQGK